MGQPWKAWRLGWTPMSAIVAPSSLAFTARVGSPDDRGTAYGSEYRYRFGRKADSPALHYTLP